MPFYIFISRLVAVNSNDPKPGDTLSERAQRTELLGKLDIDSTTATSKEILKSIVPLRKAVFQYPAPPNKKRKKKEKTSEQLEELAERGLLCIAGRSPADFKFFKMKVPMMHAVATQEWQVPFPPNLTDRAKAIKKFTAIWKKQLDKEAPLAKEQAKTKKKRKKHKK